MLLVKWILKNYMQRDCDQHFSCAPRFLSSSLSSKLLILCCIWNIDHCCPRLESILAVLAQRCHHKKEHVHQHVGQPGCYDSFEGGYIRWSTPCGGQWSHWRQYWVHIQCSCGAGAGELDSRRILGPLGIGIVIGEDKRPSLQIQALPASPEVLMGKPTLRG